MAFSKRMTDKLMEACAGNESMVGYLRDIVAFEMREEAHYTKKYEDFLKTWSQKEAGLNADSCAQGLFVNCDC